MGSEMCIRDRNNTITQIQVVGYPGVAIDESKRPQLKTGGKELQCEGMYLMPGFIACTDILEE